MIEAAMIWNEPNNKSHWDFEIDPGLGGVRGDGEARRRAIAAANPRLPRVLGGISPIDPDFMQTLAAQGVLDARRCRRGAWLSARLESLARFEEWPDKLDEIRAVTDLPVWVSEVGVSTFGAEEVQDWGLRRTAELLIGTARRGSIGTASTICRAPGPRRRGTRGRRLVLLPAFLYGLSA